MDSKQFTSMKVDRYIYYKYDNIMHVITEAGSTNGDINSAIICYAYRHLFFAARLAKSMNTILSQTGNV